MQELIDKIAHETQSLFTFAALLQIVSLIGVALMSVWIGRRGRTTTSARAVEAEPCLRARLIEGLIIVSPHMTALVLTALVIGALSAAKQPIGLAATAITLLGLLALIRGVVYVLRVSV